MTIRKLLLACALVALPASADLLVDLDPVGGAIAGSPSQTIGWGFTFTTTDSKFYALTTVEVCFPACGGLLFGTFSDYAASVNFLIIGPAGYVPSGYSETFNPMLSLGLGEIAISPTASPQTLSGTIRIEYQVTDDDPMLGGPSTGGSVSVPVTVAVVPEPSSVAMFSLAGVAVCFAGLRRRRARAISSC